MALPNLTKAWEGSIPIVPGRSRGPNFVMRSSYDDLLKHTVELEVSNLRLYALDLETLIEVRKETISEKEKAIIPILQRTLEEKLKQ